MSTNIHLDRRSRYDDDDDYVHYNDVHYNRVHYTHQVKLHDCYSNMTLHTNKNTNYETESDVQYHDATSTRRRHCSIQKIFPPILYTNVKYTNGIRLSLIVMNDVTTVIKDNDKEKALGIKEESKTSHHFVTASIPKNYYHHSSSAAAGGVVSPSPLPIQLTLQQSYLWSIPYMADYIVTLQTKKKSRMGRQTKYIPPPVRTSSNTGTGGTTRILPKTTTTTPINPHHTFRLLGTITRTILCNNSIPNDDDVNHNHFGDLISLLLDSQRKIQKNYDIDDDDDHRRSSYYNYYHHNRSTTYSYSDPSSNTTRTPPPPPLTQKAMTSLYTTQQRRLQKRKVATTTPVVVKDMNQNEEMERNNQFKKPVEESEDDDDEDWDWSEIWNANITSTSTSTTSTSGYWNTQNGDLLRNRMGYDPQYMTVSELLRILQQQIQVEEAPDNNIHPPDFNSETYHGGHPNNPHDPYHNNKLMTSIYELIVILKACQELSNPTELWNIPLITVYPIVMIESFPSSSSSSRYDMGYEDDDDMETITTIVTIQLGIYAHRLLMETFTTNSLRILLNKLDGHSYHVTIPKCTTNSHNSTGTTTSTTTNVIQQSSNHNQTTNNDTMEQKNESNITMEDPIFVSSPYPIVLYNHPTTNNPVSEPKVTSSKTTATVVTTIPTPTANTVTLSETWNTTTTSTIATASTGTNRLRCRDMNVTLSPPQLQHIPKKQKVICIDVDDDDEDEDDDRKMPAQTRNISPSSTTVMELEQRQSLSVLESCHDHDDDDEAMPLIVNTVSAFTPIGLLKILENEGCDPQHMIPNWYEYYMTQIQPLLSSSTVTTTTTTTTTEAPKMRLSLLLHQQYAVVWMYHMEHLPNFGINSLFWEEREFLDCYYTRGDDDGDDADNAMTATNIISNKYYVNTTLGQIRFEPPETMRGGLLCDEMGLGKTFEIIGLIVATLPELKRETAEYNSKKGRSNYSMTHSTLIIVPAALVAQWENEIIKCTGTYLIVDIVDGLTGAVSRRTNVTGEADIVLTTYKALVRRPVASELQQRRWGRIVLDEMQEIRSSTSAIAKSCEKLEGSRRWMLSGTPIFDGIDDLRGELNFLRLEPFSAASEDGFFNFMIKQPWLEQSDIAIEALKVLGKVMLRRSKDMTIKSTGTAIMDLKPLTVEFVPVQQTKSERAIYYFLESILARIALSSEAIVAESGQRAELNRAKASRRTCLRLLRDACNAVVLLNGGMGVPSQLPALNNILIAEARRNAQQSFVLNEDNDVINQPRVLSCDEAILHLAQVQHAVRAGEDEVACMALGLGQGISNRSHATDSADAKYAEANEKLQKAKSDLVSAKSDRAKLRWTIALEMVTMGQVRKYNASKFKATWTWRSLLCYIRYENGTRVSKAHALRRGWCPSPNLVSNLHKIYPEFHWAHPNTLKMENIPLFVSTEELADTICNVLIQLGLYKSLEVALQSIRLIAVEKLLETSVWDAWLQFETEDDYNVILHKASNAQGIVIPNTHQNPMMLDVIASYSTLCDEAQSTCMSYPTEINNANQEKATKALRLAQLGLRIVHASKTHDTLMGTIKIAPAFQARKVVPRCYELTHRRLRDKINGCTDKIYSLLSTTRQEQLVINRLSIVMHKDNAGIDESIRATSAFEKLSALASGNQHETHCCICLDYLGSNQHDCTKSLATISMIDCGHLYCRPCLASCSRVCPTCRRPFNFATNVSYIDLTKTRDRNEVLLEQKERERQELRHAYQSLQESEGVMDPNLWNKLYHSIDEAENSVLDIRVPALPRHFLGHVRECIKGCHPPIPILCPPKSYPYTMDGSEPVLSSKVKALLNDLPREERSVVFSSSSATIKHLEKILEFFGFRCRSLFVGQNVESTESAVLEWQSNNEDGLDEPPCPVLLVQAGAAASGLTLTAASKMFLMEPFLRYSEELQAYGRCHRHGQTNAVYVKCYYVPMSMESQLLDRRKRAKEGSKERAATKFSKLYGDESDDDA